MWTVKRKKWTDYNYVLFPLDIELLFSLAQEFGAFSFPGGQSASGPSKGNRVSSCTALLSLV